MDKNNWFLNALFALNANWPHGTQYRFVNILLKNRLNALSLPGPPYRILYALSTLSHQSNVRLGKTDLKTKTAFSTNPDGCYAGPVRHVE